MPKNKGLKLKRQIEVTPHMNHKDKTILYLHPHFTLPGGAGRHALETGRVLAKRGWNVHIACIRYTAELIAEYEGEITFHQLGGPLSNSIGYWPHLPLLLYKASRCIERTKPQIVFSQVFPANWWGFINAFTPQRNWSHVWMCQEPSAFIHSRRWISSLPFSPAGIAARLANPLLKTIDVRLAQQVDYVFANSEFSTQLAFDAYHYSTDKVGICYPGVDTTRFVFKHETPKTKYKFITCARLTKFKNIDKIICALKTIDRADVSLTIIGRGEEYEGLTRLTHDLKLEERVVFLQTVSDQEMISELQSSYALIHAAEEEPFGLTPVEAMACGTPVIAIRGGGPAETVVHEGTGLLCDKVSAEGIAQAMRWLIAYEDKMDSIRAACVQRAQLFTWESATNSLEDVMLRLL
jgi:glycosyltransferase involved in cell wall biosynthesis